MENNEIKNEMTLFNESVGKVYCSKVAVTTEEKKELLEKIKILFIH